MSQKHETNKFSEESQQSLADMNHTEIFELFDGRNLKYSRSLTTSQKTNCDFTSVLGFFINKNSSRGPKHGVSGRQVMFYKAKQMLKKARQGKHGNHPTIFSWWCEQEGYRRSLAEHKIGEKEVMFFDRIALERHDYTATKAERLQNAKHWILRLNAGGSLRQRPEFAVALRRSLDGNAAISQTDTSRTSTTSTRRSTIRRRRKLRLLRRSENWMTVLQRATGKPVGSVFIFTFAVANFTIANKLELIVFHIMVVFSVSWKEFQKIHGVCRQDTHSQDTSVAQDQA